MAGDPLKVKPCQQDPIKVQVEPKPILKVRLEPKAPLRLGRSKPTASDEGSRGKPRIGKTKAFECPYCKTEIKEGEAYYECSSCHAEYHQDCWEVGGCSVLGCDART